MKHTSHLRRIIAMALLAAALPLAAQNKLPADTVARSLSRDVVTADQVSQQQVTNPLEAINGRVAGVTIQKSNKCAVRLRSQAAMTR